MENLLFLGVPILKHIRVCYRIRQENTKFTVSFPGKAMLKLKNIPKPARFSRLGVDSPEVSQKGEERK